MLRINGLHFLTQSKLVDYSRRLPVDPSFWFLISEVEGSATLFPDLLVLILPTPKDGMIKGFKPSSILWQEFVITIPQEQLPNC